MNCQERQIKFLNDTNDLTPEAIRHLDKCQECRSFVHSYQWLCPPTPSPELDSRVLNSYRMQMQAKTRRRRWRRLLVAAPLAAAIVLLLSLAGLFQKTAPLDASYRAVSASAASTEQALASPKRSAAALEPWYLNWLEADTELANLELELTLLASDL